jgi:peptidoglycan/xylan/chitin deacetylase (PgdA/CDA1 family)
MRTTGDNGPGRDFTGYGQSPPAIRWPDGSRIALSIVVNYEEGSERSVELGDPVPESVGEFAPTSLAVRDMGMESVYEYGTRVAIWRMLDTLKSFGIRATFFTCGRTAELSPETIRAIDAAGHEIVGHGYLWREHFEMDEKSELDSITRTREIIRGITGKEMRGWYCREPSHRTYGILQKLGFLYSSDSYADDVPYYMKLGNKKRLLIVPYTPDANDFHFFYQRFANSDDFYNYLRDTFDTLYRESKEHTKLMSVGLHTRISGRPGRIVAFRRFMRYVKGKNVWIATRGEIAEFWKERYSK